jgi:hypothetical protein
MAPAARAQTCAGVRSAFHLFCAARLRPPVQKEDAMGFLIVFLGAAERAAIVEEYRTMLGRLCEIKKVWRLPK